MKKFNGFDLGIRVKEVNDKIKVIIISAYENIDGNLFSFELLQKPILLQIFLAQVNSYIN
jgi:two-component SAPR family response regulator